MTPEVNIISGKAIIASVNGAEGSEAGGGGGALIPSVWVLGGGAP